MYFATNKEIIRDDYLTLKSKLAHSDHYSFALLLDRFPYCRNLVISRLLNGRVSRTDKLINKICYLFAKPVPYFAIITKNIGERLVMYHPYATFLNCKKIGDNCIVRNCTTIGNKDENQNLRPTIGNNVNIGVNVAIIGDITIGNNVIIGAGSVVVKDVPSNCVVAGNPAHIIRRIDSTKN